MASTRVRTGLAGTAGEYHVVAELSKRGWLATITIKNAPGTDVLAQHVDTGRLVAIQTKTSTASDSFILGVKDETPTERDDAWYVLVRLRGLDQRPDFYVMPRNHVSAACFVSHRNWLVKPGRGGRAHQDNPMRQIDQSDIQSYRERWDWLLEPATHVQYELPDWFGRDVADVGLPEGHPDAARFSPAADGQAGEIRSQQGA